MYFHWSDWCTVDKYSTILSRNILLPAMSQKYRIGPVGSKRSKHSILGTMATCLNFNSLCNQISDSVMIMSQWPKTSNDHKRQRFNIFNAFLFSNPEAHSTDEFQKMCLPAANVLPPVAFGTHSPKTHLPAAKSSGPANLNSNSVSNWSNSKKETNGDWSLHPLCLQSWLQ